MKHPFILVFSLIPSLLVAQAHEPMMSTAKLKQASEKPTTLTLDQKLKFAGLMQFAKAIYDVSQGNTNEGEDNPTRGPNSVFRIQDKVNYLWDDLSLKMLGWSKDLNSDKTALLKMELEKAGFNSKDKVSDVLVVKDFDSYFYEDGLVKDVAADKPCTVRILSNDFQYSAKPKTIRKIFGDFFGNAHVQVENCIYTSTIAMAEVNADKKEEDASKFSFAVSMDLKGKVWTELDQRVRPMDEESTYSFYKTKMTGTFEGQATVQVVGAENPVLKGEASKLSLGDQFALAAEWDLDQKMEWNYADAFDVLGEYGVAFVRADLLNEILSCDGSLTIDGVAYPCDNVLRFTNDYSADLLSFSK